MSERISPTPFVIIGLVGSALLALLTLPFPYHRFFSFWVGFYGLMMLLACPGKRPTPHFIFAPLIPSLIAALIYYWSLKMLFSPWKLAFFSSLAINAFYIHYQKNDTTLSYSTLFRAVWDSIIKLTISFIFILMCWPMLLLCDQLFKLIHITFIHTLIDQKWFDIAVSSIFAATGLYIASYSEITIDNIRAGLVMMCRYLLIPLAIISILFIVFSAINVAQEHTLPTSDWAFLTTAFLSALFLNGVYQDGTTPIPYPRVLFWIFRIFLVLTPIFTLIALHTLYFYASNNINNNGLNTANLADFINASLLLIYNLCYALIALSWKQPPFKPIEKTNIVLSVLLIIIALLSTNPLIAKHVPSYQPFKKNTAPGHNKLA